jgi:BCD family chlorophyll transporter-like MFS transporter
MNALGRRAIRAWVDLGPRFLPFADVATADLPLSRLLRLSLFQVSCGMAMVLLVGTLNRVMIVELGVPASLVGAMVALPLVFAPFRALIGYRSDTHRCELGWRRVPFIWKGTLLQFGGFAIMPFALLVLAGKGQAEHAPAWLGLGSAALAFLLVGAGVHIVQTVGLALATDLLPQESHPKVVGLMYVMLLAGMVGSALVFGAALEDFTPGRLVQVIQGAAVATMALNVIALWKQETRRPRHGAPLPAPDPSFRESFARFCAGEHAVRRLLAIGVGTMAFAMADILLEPFGGQVLGMTVGSTTKLTALLAAGGIMGFTLASWVLARGADPFRMTLAGAAMGIPAFGLIIVAAPLHSPSLFLLGNFLVGFSGALFGHGTLTATMSLAPREQAGLALGAWGAVQATGAGLGVAISGALRDLVNGLVGPGAGPFGLTVGASGYLTVYALEALLLGAAIIAVVPLLRRRGEPAHGFSGGPTTSGLGPGVAP